MPLPDELSPGRVGFKARSLAAYAETERCIEILHKKKQTTGVSDERTGKQQPHGDAKERRYCYTLHSFTDELVEMNNRRHISCMRNVAASSPVLF